MTVFSVRFVDRLTGAVKAELPAGGSDPRSGFVVSRGVRELLGPGQVEFSFPTRHPKMRQFRGGGLAGLELQFWREDDCWWWGPITSVKGNLNIVSGVARGHLWFFTGLNFGPITTNYLTNPNFSTGTLAGWTPTGVTSAFDPTQIIRTTPGGVPGSAKLTQAVAGQDTYLRQVLGPFAIAGQALFFNVAGWYRLNPTGTYMGPAYLERGLYVGRLDLGLNPIISRWDKINNRRPAWGVWQRQKTGISIPDGNTEYLDVRLYAPGLTSGVNWGALSVTVEESVSYGSAGAPVDVLHLIQAIFDYAQDTSRQKAPLGLTFGRADGSPNPLVGVLWARAYQFFDLGGVWDALREFADTDVAEFGIEWDRANPAGKYFEVYPGQRGTYHPNLRCEVSLGPAGERRSRLLSDYGFEYDLERAANDVTWLGTGSSGSDREFGRSRDTAALGGLIRQKIRTAPSDAALDTLDSRAQADRLQLASQVEVPTLTVPGALSRVVREGDSLPVSVDLGFAYETTTRRINAMTLDPATDLLLLEVS